ncbi:MAG: DUF1538 domain-containing protein [Candidatus Ancaeobacter aquaticus]|nr:DUF1538 domain-containing protein [Candidatus Ancaeobacter aquaticus]
MDVIIYIAKSFFSAVLMIVPLVMFLLFYQMVVMRTKVHGLKNILVGILVCVIGLAIFNEGLIFGLMQLGSQVGGSMKPPPITAIITIGIFTFILGYGATMAEPALLATALQAEELTSGALKKNLFIQAVAVGVAVGVTLGILRLVYHWPLMYILIPSYLFTIFLTFVSSARTIPISWDAGGVTTGPITVPLVLALGLGVSAGADGFGILSLASVYPIMSVLLLGVVTRRS